MTEVLKTKQKLMALPHNTVFQSTAIQPKQKPFLSRYLEDKVWAHNFDLSQKEMS